MKAKHYTLLITTILLLVGSALATIFTDLRLLFGLMTLCALVVLGVIIVWISEDAN